MKSLNGGSMPNEFEEKIAALAKSKSMPRPLIGDSKFARTLNETLTAPQDRPEVPPPGDPIPDDRRMEIQAQIDAELRKQGRI